MFLLKNKEIKFIKITEELEGEWFEDYCNMLSKSCNYMQSYLEGHSEIPSCPAALCICPFQLHKCSEITADMWREMYYNVDNKYEQVKKDIKD